MLATTLGEVVSRAETGWPLDTVPYSQSGVWNDDDGRTDEDGYRRDCAGFASMAGGLTPPGLNTVTLVTTGATRRITWAELLPGDLVMLGGWGTSGDAGHVGVVVALNPGARTYTMLEQSGGRGPDRTTYTLGTGPRAGMLPYRFVHVAPPGEEDMPFKFRQVPHGTVYAIGREPRPDGKIPAVPLTGTQQPKINAWMAEGVPFTKGPELDARVYHVTAVDAWSALGPGTAASLVAHVHKVSATSDQPQV